MWGNKATGASSSFYTSQIKSRAKRLCWLKLPWFVKTLPGSTLRSINTPFSSQQDSLVTHINTLGAAIKVE